MRGFTVLGFALFAGAANALQTPAMADIFDAAFYTLLAGAVYALFARF